MGSLGRVVALIASGVVMLTACGTSGTTPPTSHAPSPVHSAKSRPNGLAVTLDQWTVDPASTAQSSGRVAFVVSNQGTVPHEFVVLRTDTQASDIPVGTFEGEADRINEDTAGTNVGETGDMEAGTTKTVTIELQPGHYILLCNLPGHYELGMHTDFTVTG